MSKIDIMDDDDDDYETWRTVLSYCNATLCTAMCLLTTIFIAVVVRTRRFTFNIYLVFLLLPDAMLSGVYGILGFYEATNRGIGPTALCYLRNFLLLFYYHSNLYMNAVVAKQVCTLVVNSYHRKRTKPPTAREVLVQAFGVYLGTGLLALWYVLPVAWSPVVVSTKPYCTSYFGSETFGFWGGMIIVVILSTPPFVYVFWIAYTVWKRNLLPLRGRTRALALFFVRIIVVFVACYTPQLVVAMIKTTIPPERHDSTSLFVLLQINTVLNPIQTIFTLYFLMQKDDIAQALQISVTRISAVSSFYRRKRESRSSQEPRPSQTRRPTNVHDGGEWDADDTYGDNHEGSAGPYQTARESTTGGGTSETDAEAPIERDPAAAAAAAPGNSTETDKGNDHRDGGVS